MSIIVGFILMSLWTGSPEALAFGGKPKLEEPPIPIVRRDSLLHSHNDYEQPHPLEDALSARLDSVEADILLIGGQLLVTHGGLDSTKGTLQELYLDPLQRIVDRDGSVHRNGRMFYLWIDLKSGSKDLITRLHEVLMLYPMLTRFSDSGTESGPVTVILTGDEGNKKRYVDSYSTRYATRDSNDLGGRDPAASSRWLWYALDYRQFFSWTGWGQMPEDQRNLLGFLVREVRATGRKLRIFNSPDYETWWNVAMDADVDMVGTDRVQALRNFVDQSR